MNNLASQNQNPNVDINTKAPVINTATYNGQGNNQVVLSNLVVNTSSLANTVAGSVPIYTGGNVNDTVASAIINQNVSGVSINGALAISGYPDVGATLGNIATLLNNLTGLTV
jgi:hypothetical protein